MSDELVARVFRLGFGSWWVEVFRPRDDERDPPEPDRRLDRDPWPPYLPGYTRIALEECLTRVGARRAARRMVARIHDGLHPKHDAPEVEIVYGEPR